MLNVVEFKSTEDLANQSCIELLEDWLERAKSGEVISVAIAGVTSDNNTTSQWSDLTHAALTIGALHFLVARITNNTIDD